MRAAISATMVMKKILTIKKIASANAINADVMMNRATIAIATVIATIAHARDLTIPAVNKNGEYNEE